MNEPLNEFEMPERFIGRRVLPYDTIDSTNARALELARDEANDGVVLFTNEQTAGRGRLGRSWQAAPGSSVLMSVILFPPEHLSKPAILTAWAAVAVCRLVKEVTNKEARIKWPNDVLLDGKKVAGILLERGGPDQRAVVTGIGVNCTQTPEDFEAAGLPDATSLLEDAIAHPLPALVMGCLIRLLDQEYEWLRTGDPGTLEAAWRRYIGLVGQEVEVEGPSGGLVRGTLRRLRFSGVDLEQPRGVVTRLEPERVQHLRGVG
jgi:BirA family biotin operon repressor/biotin-[acetyl-CoA-carboxylase] ligase